MLRVQRKATMEKAHFLIGVDSDGTAFDSMNKKHIDAFIPAAMEIWQLHGEIADSFSEIEKEVNLFSSLRGINRFPGLLEVFERLEKAFPDTKDLPDLTDLRQYIQSQSRYSPSTLGEWIQGHPSEELEKVLAWSYRADQLFAIACEDLMPFPGVQEALTCAAGSACIAVISSAAKDGLERDWKAGGLLTSVSILMSQEDGNKTNQLKKAMAQCAPDVQTLMIGDTNSDAVAAHEAGVRFYPIIPGHETDSWADFKQTILPMFLLKQYGKEKEEEYYSKLAFVQVKLN